MNSYIASLIFATIQHSALPKSYSEQKAFKAQVLSRRKKPDEENFEEAESQAVRMWSEKVVRGCIIFRTVRLVDVKANKVPSDIANLLKVATSAATSTDNQAFHALLHVLQLFISHPDGPGDLPLTSALPDMRTDTESYIKIQKMYKEQARVENVR